MARLQAVQTKPKPEVTVPKCISLGVFQVAIGLSAEIARVWYGYVRTACLEFCIVGAVRIVAFLAQAAYKLGCLAWMRELRGQLQHKSAMRAEPS